MNSLFFNYATALLDLSKEENLELFEIRSSIKNLVEVFQKNRDFAAFLTAVNISYEEKCGVVEKVLVGYPKIILNFIKLIISKNRAFYIYDILKESLTRFDSYLNLETGIIYSSEPLSIENIKKLTIALEAKKNKRIELVNEIDKSLIGGFKIVLNSDIYDASIKTKIEKIKQSLITGGK